MRMRAVSAVLALLLALVGNGADAFYTKVKQNNAKCFIEVIVSNQVHPPAPSLQHHAFLILEPWTTCLPA